MRSIWSYGGLVLALVLAAALIVPGFLDWSRYAGLIETQAEALTGRDVDIAGDVRISLLPTPTLTLGKMTIANAQGTSAANMVEIESMTAELSVGSLFRGDLIISRLSMEKPSLLLEVTDEGRGNWQFLPSGAEPADTDPSRTDASNSGPSETPSGRTDPVGTSVIDALPPISVDEIEVVSGRIGLRNLGVGTDFELTGINALVGAEGLLGPYRAKGEALIAGESAAFVATLGEVSPEKAYPANLSLTFAQAEATFSGIATGRGSDIRFDGAVSVGVASELSPALAALTTGHPISLSGGVVASASGVEVRDIQAEAGAVTLSGALSAKAGPSIDLDANVVLNRIDLTGFETSGLSLGVTAVSDAVSQAVAQAPQGMYKIVADELRLPMGIVREVDLTAEAGGDTISISAIKARMPGDAMLTAQGAVSVGGEGAYFSGDVDVQSAQPREFAAWVNRGDVPHFLSAMPLQSLAAKGGVFLTPARVSIDKLQLELDGGMVSGRAGMSFADRPVVDVSLAVEKVALPADHFPVLSRIVPGRPIDLGFDGAVALSVEVLDASAVHLENISVKLASQGSNITVSEFLFQSELGASATLTGQSTRDGGRYQATLTAPSPASLEGLVDLPQISLGGIAPLSMSAQATWPDAVALPGAIGGASQTVAFSVLGRAGDVQVETEGQFAPGYAGNSDAVYAVTSIFTADQWQKLMRVGTAVSGVAGPAFADAIADGALEEGAPDAPIQRVTAAIEGVRGRPAALAVEVSLDVLSGSVAGELNLATSPASYDLDVDLAVMDFVPFARAAGYAARDIDTLEAKGGLTFDGNGFEAKAADLRVSGAHGVVAGVVGGRAANKDDRVTGAIAVEAREIDVPFLMGLLDGSYFEAGPKTETEDEPAPDGYWNTGLLKTQWMEVGDFDITFNGGDVALGGLVADQLVLEATLKDGRLDVPDLRGVVLGGELRGTLAVVAGNGLEFEASLAGTNLDAGIASQALGVGSLGTGAADFDMTVSGAGLSALALVSSLKGAGSIKVTDGTLAGVDLAALSDGLQRLEKPEDFAPLAEATLTSGATPYEEIAGNVVITSGVLRAPDISLNLESGSAKTAAFADIGRAALDVETMFKLDEPARAPEVQIVVSGDFTNPERRVNSVELEAYAGRKLLEREIEQLDGDARSELRVILDLPANASASGSEAQTAPAPSSTP